MKHNYPEGGLTVGVHAEEVYAIMKNVRWERVDVNYSYMHH